MVACAAVGALLPLLSCGLVTLMDERVGAVLLAPFIILWSLVSSPGILLPGRGSTTFLLIELFWIVLGALGGIILARVMRRSHQHATPKA